MFYVTKGHQTGWEGKESEFEYTLYNPDKKIKTTLNCTTKHMKVVVIFFDTETIAPSTAQRKRLYEYSTVSRTKFLGYDK